MDYPYEYGKLKVASFILADTLKSALKSDSDMQYYKPLLEVYTKQVLDLMEVKDAGEE
jgi:hypothetical protein